MRTPNRICFLGCCVGLLASSAFPQWTPTGGGDWYLSPTPTQPNSVAVGTNTNNTAALVVDGTQMATTIGDAFKTVGPSTSLLTWRMYRNASNGYEIGRLWSPATTGGTGSNAFSFNIQQMQAGTYSPASNIAVSLWLRNAHDNGIRLIDDVAMDLQSSSTGVAYTNVPRVGYVAIGNAGNMGASTR